MVSEVYDLQQQVLAAEQRAADLGAQLERQREQGTAAVIAHEAALSEERVRWEARLTDSAQAHKAEVGWQEADCGT
jgi:hypothetical protein